MKDLLLLFFLVAVCSTFIINQSQKRDQSYTFTSSEACSDYRVSLVNQSLEACKYYGYQIGPTCIKNYILSRDETQKWDVIGQSNASDAKSSYWYYNDCSIVYEQTYPAKVKFTIWKASLGQQDLSNRQNQQKGKIIQNFGVDNCTFERQNAAFYAINYCQNNNSSLQAICIKNNIMTRSGQKWNALIWTITTGLAYKYDYYDGCNFRLNQHGPNYRNYLLWKAQ